MTRRAVVSGGTSGIGLAAAQRLRAEGIEVLTLDISPTADLVVDVTDSAAVRQAAQDAGAVDILVNSAGIIGPRKPLWEVTDEEWDVTLAVNLTGTFNLCRAFVPGLVERGWGRIVNVSAVAGKFGNAQMSAYSASKAAVIALTKSLGKELATSGVLVNSIAPATVTTPMHADLAHGSLEQIATSIPMGRAARPEEVGELIAWLCSDLMSFSTGAVYDISGGRATY